MSIKKCLASMGVLLCLMGMSLLHAAGDTGVAYTRIVAGTDGESSFEAGEFPYAFVDLGDFRAGVSPLEIGERGTFMMFPSGTFEDFHPTPNAQILVVVQGQVEVGTSDGDKRRFGPGDVVLMQDNSGKGHTTRTFGAADHIALMIPYEG